MRNSLCGSATRTPIGICSIIWLRAKAVATLPRRPSTASAMRPISSRRPRSGTATPALPCAISPIAPARRRSGAPIARVMIQAESSSTSTMAPATPSTMRSCCATDAVTAAEVAACSSPSRSFAAATAAAKALRAGVSRSCMNRSSAAAVSTAAIAPSLAWSALRPIRSSSSRTRSWPVAAEIAPRMWHPRLRGARRVRCACRSSPVAK